MGKKIPVGLYLIKRLYQIGVKHVFGVPGDYILKFYDYLEKSELKTVGNCNELNAGYAADAYARLNGIGVVCVTYTVGGLSLLNAVAGSAAEMSPVIVISGAPKLQARYEDLILHHSVISRDLQFEVYKKVVEKAVILDPENAPQQIDDTICTCLHTKKPVYIEIPTDVVSVPVSTSNLSAPNWCTPPVIDVNKDAVEEASTEIFERLHRAQKPLIIAGIEVARFGLSKKLLRFIKASGCPFAVSYLCKGSISEDHASYIGTYIGATSSTYVKKRVNEADVILCLGVLNSDLNLSLDLRLDRNKLIVAFANKIADRQHTFHSVPLDNLLNALIRKFHGKTIKDRIFNPFFKQQEQHIPQDKKITIKRFYERIMHFLTMDNIVVADTGDSLFNSVSLHLPKGVPFLLQALYGSIGFATPATLGACLAKPKKRTILFVGDGAFQVTAQEISTLVRHKLTPIIFLLNNDGYTIERYLIDGAFNDIQMWNYCKLPEVFNAKAATGMKVHTEAELEQALLFATNNPNKLVFIEVILGKFDCSDSLRITGKAFQKNLSNK